MAKLTHNLGATLLELSIDLDTLNQDIDQIRQILDALDEDEIKTFMTDPDVSTRAKRNILSKSFEEEDKNKRKENLLQIIKDRGSEDYVDEFESHPPKMRRNLGYSYARVVSAKKLNPDQMASIRQIIEKQFGKEVKIISHIDPDIIAGYYIFCNGQILDTTVRTELNRMKERIKRGTMMQVKPNQIADIIKKEIESYEGKYEFTEAGSVIQVGDGIARVSGLQNAMSGELLEFSNGTYGMAQNLDQDSIGVIIMGSDAGIKEGDPVKLTGRMADVPVGDAMLGRVVNALGEPIDDNGPITTDKFRLIESEAPTVIERGEVNNPLHTGIKAIDALVPIGKGQRELIIGDRETGKTTIAIDSILNQKGKDVHCIYVAIGQKSSTLARIIRILTEAGAMEYTTIVFSAANESAAMQYFTPYSGTAMAEEWMHQGKDVLIVYDDLSKHAVAYRAISLLLGRPPGREAYPGDIFYLHSRLLERSGQLSDEQGGGSITALPIVETQGGDISAYVPTNIISITDGQIYLESELFNHGIRPAINPGLSVSRVGGSAQIDAMKNLAGPLRIEFAQYNELSVFAQFGTDLDENTLDRLNHGEKIQEILKQPQHRPLAIEEQVLMLYALNNGYLDDIETNRVLRFQREFLRYVEIHASEILEEIAKTGKLSEELATRIDQLIVDVKAEYSYK